VNVHFRTYLGDAILDEQESLARRDELRAQSDVKVEVDLGDGVVVADSLSPLLQELLQRAPDALERGEPYSMQYARHPGDVRLTPDGDEVAVEGDFIAGGRFPREELIAGLRAAGERLAGL
jgi:hypothetical protein